MVNNKKFFKKKSLSLSEKKLYNNNKKLASILGSMLNESFEFELFLKHGCEQQILEQSPLRISSNCYPLTFCRNKKNRKSKEWRT